MAFFILGDMTIQRMDNVAIVVDDLDAAVAFFTELGLELEKSGRRESNPHSQLGRSVLAHGHLCCSSNALVSRSAFPRSVTAYLSVLLASGS